MAFRKEIHDFLNPLKYPYAFRFTVVDGFGAYFENVIKISEISTYSVTLLFKSGVVKVSGCNLKIAKYCDGDLAISGKISVVERCE